MLSWMIEAGLWPQILTVDSSVILLVSSLFTSALTAAFGLGGGVIMLALLVNFLPVAVVIPVHGVIQAGSNCSRALLLRKHIVWPIIGYFFIGAVVGALLGGQFVVALPEGILLAILGTFILYIVWGPKPKAIKQGKLSHIVGGILITFSTMFIGATGPLAMALLPRKEMLSKQISATHGTLMIVQHGLKIVIFSALGFQFKEWAVFLLMMLGTGFIGTYSGRSILQRLPQHYFQYALTAILTLLAIKMLFDAALLLL
ncbi:MAG: sulfite exporter TauE/SafE family protein [Pseudomonadales bacterium]|nr:sulfite exporter TauE/SafE family protein [Pseudomonadales bacterium]NRA15808.1 sulfite exporter TauE/SafE family protein [Oceanospirillaceae bacterium]